MRATVEYRCQRQIGYWDGFAGRIVTKSGTYKELMAHAGHFRKLGPAVR